ncbi:hypothetical protein [Streptomyces cavernicola]|uniref:PBS lyase n=1 Tax=Streptomyces cavernicola TaxID=3043613 RepID=A0ABT6SBA6_9ACTN|nr:hypothetical protein [Streptomyces sp. B-S-A6]MDI3405179.1 hypothetical protein [Streptomyces sp. B-S-A6]
MSTLIELIELNDADWAGAGHAYGDGADTLKWLREACGGDPQSAARAVDVLHNCLVHQGTVYEGSARAYPVLVRLLLDPAAPRREQLADLLLAIGTGGAATDAVRHEIRTALAASAPSLLPLLADPRREVRHRIAYLTGICAGLSAGTQTGYEKGAALAALRERALAEPDPLVAAVMVGAVAVRDAEGSAQWLYGALSPAHSPGVRAAAAWGIARAGLSWPVEATAAATEAWAHGDVLNGDVIAGEEWRWSDSPLAETLAAMGDPERAAAICLRLVRSEDEDTAECGALAALDLLDEHPDSYRELALLAEPLRSHPDSGIRSYADDLEELLPRQDPSSA